MTVSMRFEAVLEKASDWVDAVASELGTTHKRAGYAALRATLHALRDSLDMERAVQLGEELPMLIRGLYYEGWGAGNGPPRIRGLVDFLESVRHALRGHAELLDSTKAAQATFAALGKLLSRSEIDAIVSWLPSDIRQLSQPQGAPA